jgi:hypothetical protein
MFKILRESIGHDGLQEEILLYLRENVALIPVSGLFPTRETRTQTKVPDDLPPEILFLLMCEGGSDYVQHYAIKFGENEEIFYISVNNCHQDYISVFFQIKPFSTIENGGVQLDVEHSTGVPYEYSTLLQDLAQAATEQDA